MKWITLEFYNGGEIFLQISKIAGVMQPSDQQKNQGIGAVVFYPSATEVDGYCFVKQDYFAIKKLLISSECAFV